MLKDPIIAVSKESNKHPIIVLTKCLLQLGLTPIFSGTIPESFLVNDLAPLCHPFIDRRLFFSQVEVKRFVVPRERIEELVAISEELESKADEAWGPYSSNSAPIIQLSNKNNMHSKYTKVVTS
jgi:hypothetical protein